MLKVNAPKPEDAKLRPVTWCLVTGEPGYWYAGTFTEVDAAWIDARIEDMGRLMASGYQPPALEEHEEEGERLGAILSPGLRVQDDEGRERWVVPVAWNDPDAPELIESERWKYTSPKIGPRYDERGDLYPYALWHLAVTVDPHQVHLNPTHFVGSAMPMPDPNAAPPPQPNPQQAPSVEERLAAQDSRIAGLEEALRALTAAIEATKPPEPPPMPETTPAPAAMSAEVATLRAELAAERALRLRAEVRSSAPPHAAAVMSAAAMDALINAVNTPDDATRAKTILGGLTAPNPDAPGTVLMSAGAGATNTPSNNPERDAASLYSRCLAEAGGDKVKAHQLYRSRR